MITPTPENFDNYIKNRTQSLSQSKETFALSENEMMTKVIMEFQYNSILASLNSMDKLSSTESERYLTLTKELLKMKSVSF